MALKFVKPGPTRLQLRSTLRALCVVLLSLGICFATSGAATASTAKKAAVHSSLKPVYGGTLNVGINNTPTCADPQQTSATATENVLDQVFSTLIAQNPKNAKLVPWLASSWTTNKTATLYTFHLQKGVKFSNGQAFNASVVAANLKRIINLGSLSPRGSEFLADFSGTTVVNPYEIEVHFSVPNAVFIVGMANPAMAMLAPASLTLTPSQACSGTGLYGIGPFVLTSFTPTQTIETRWNGFKWPSALATHKGKAYLNEIIFNLVSDPAVSDGSLESGQLDVAMNAAYQDRAALLEAGCKIDIFHNPGDVVNLAMNLNNPLTADVSVRRAVQHAINRGLINQEVYWPSYGVPTSVLAPTTVDYANESRYMTFDPTESEQILQNDGWVMGSNGYRVKNGTTLHLTAFYPGSVSTYAEEFTIIQQELAKVGIELTFTGISAAQLTSTEKGGTYSMFETTGTLSDPDILRGNFGSAFSNDLFLSPNSELNTLLNRQAETASPGNRKTLWAEIQKLFIADAYVIPINQQANPYAYRGDVHGFETNDNANFVFYDTWKS